jgi:hypothetical protein
MRAGERRERMARICFDGGRYAEATEDWLSAASCFVLATASVRSAEILKLVEELIAEGKVPADRRDLYAALAECNNGLKQLERKAKP